MTAHPFPSQPPQAAAPKRWLRTKEAAEHCGLSPATLERYRTSGDGPPFHKAGRAVLYAVDELDAWITAGRAHNTAEARAHKRARDDRLRVVGGELAPRRRLGSAS